MNETGLPSWLLLSGYCALILLASLAGGWLPLLLRPTHTRMQTCTSFVAGLMLGVGLLHLLPHSWHQLHSLDRAVGWLVAGFLAMFFIQRFFHFHHHDVPEEPAGENGPHHHDHHHEHSLDHSACGNLAVQSAQRLSWTGATLGLVLHTLIDGAAVAASVEAETHAHAHGLLAGFGTFLVVFLHKPFDAMAVGALMARGGRSRAFCHLVNGLLALAIPAGVLLFHLGLGNGSPGAQQFVGAALAFSAGTFLCIATSDLLPELQFHSHDRLKLSAALLLGLGMAAFIGRFETAGHDRHEPATTNSVPAALDHDSHDHR
ncbi:MAG: ZIP family metal transporter [Verrucomicrobia bacterium]|nr:ZIP family metal transporter [Verrucomicrobiota bacterium]